ncbi:MAG: hypothetical protein M1837_000696 [Sclerophora amabilis]|nr:MAG: hypothetical protein M1837_000696 [Sclerophora amabilis]
MKVKIAEIVFPNEDPRIFSGVLEYLYVGEYTPRVVAAEPADWEGKNLAAFKIMILGEGEADNILRGAAMAYGNLQQSDPLLRLYFNG